MGGGWEFKSLLRESEILWGGGDGQTALHPPPLPLQFWGEGQGASQNTQFQPRTHTWQVGLWHRLAGGEKRLAAAPHHNGERPPAVPGGALVSLLARFPANLSTAWMPPLCRRRN